MVLPVSRLPYKASDRWITDELERISEETLSGLIEVAYYPSNCLERLRKNTKNLSQYTQSPSRDSNRVAVEYKSRALPLDKLVVAI
jgi:hypothetical protein